MSFRLFLIHCAQAGAWAALFGWLFGTMLAPAPAPDSAWTTVWRTSIQGFFLGLSVALGLSLLDAIWVLSGRQLGEIIRRVLAAGAVGSVGGFVSAGLGQLLFGLTQWRAFFLFGWTIVGLLVGFSIGSYEWLRTRGHQQQEPAARKKVWKCSLGGCLGGILGGGLALLLREFSEWVTDKDVQRLWSPTAAGFIALGGCIGFLVGLAQVMLKEAWIKVEAGFRPGREMILVKERTTLGRAEGADLPLFGDSGVEKLHAQIVLEAQRYWLEDHATRGGTFVNDQRIHGRTPLQSGDLIRLGKSVLRFRERQRRR
jgi:hypothetical protein